MSKASPIMEVEDPRQRLELVLERLSREATRRRWNNFYDQVVEKVGLQQTMNTLTYKGVVTLTLNTATDTALEQAFQNAGFNEASFITVRRNFEYIRSVKSSGMCTCPKTKAEWDTHKESLLAALKEKMAVERITIAKEDRLSVHCMYCEPSSA